MQQYNPYPASYGYGDPYAPVPQQQPGQGQYGYNDGYDYAAPAAGGAAAGAAAAAGAGQYDYTDTPGQGYNYGPNGEYYFDPSQAQNERYSYRDEPSTGGHGGSGEDAYGGYADYDSPMPLTGGHQYQHGQGQVGVGTPPNEQSDPLHVCPILLFFKSNRRSSHGKL